MKKFFSLLLVALTLLSCTACQTADDTTAQDGTDPVITDAPQTDATQTVPDTQEIPDDPTFDPDEKEDEGTKKMIFEFDFAAGKNTADSFTVITDNFTFSEGVGYKTTAQNGILRIKDNNIGLKGKSIMVEGDITFDVLPHKADGVTNFPLSIISWIRKDLSDNTTYDWIFKMDENGTLYIKNGTTPSTAKIEAGKRYTFGVLFDENEG